MTAKRRLYRNRRAFAAFALVIIISMVLGLIAVTVRAAALPQLEVDTAQFFVAQDSETKGLIIMGIVQISNKGTEDLAKLEFPLPKGADNVSPAGGIEKDISTREALVDGAGIKAGAAKNIMFTYTVAAPDGRLDLVMPMPYATKKLIFAARSDLQISADGLVPAGETQLDGVAWVKLGKDNVPAGGTVAAKIKIVGPPPAFADAGPAAGTGAAQGPQASRGTSTKPEDLIAHQRGPDTWKAVGHFGIIIVAFALVFKGIAFPTRRKPKAAEVQLDGTARALMRQIASLDLDHEQGKLNDEDFQRLRRRLKAELIGAITAPAAEA